MIRDLEKAPTRTTPTITNVSRRGFVIGEAAPYDGILVTAATPCIPAPLAAQLAPGGRIAVPVGDLQLLTFDF